MKISLNWIREYLAFELPDNAELISKIGSQIGGIDEVVDLGAKYQKIVIVKIISCQPVPDSDHLNVCLIDDGNVTSAVERDEAGLVQVVCGAPNVRAGLSVAWLPPGATVPSSYDKDPFVLGARELRGYVSNGMLASPQELAIGDNHDGILELDDHQPGTSFATAYGLDDTIIDIENKMFTHRPDCFGIVGVAREIAGIFGKPFVEPNWYATFTKNLLPIGEQLPLTVHNLAPELVPRLMAVVLSGLNVVPSNVKLQTYLSRVGIRPINNIVDTTNYYMYLTGQPLHAYDYDKVKALDGQSSATLVARQVQAGEQLVLLNGKTIEPRSGAIVIATNSQIIGLAGVMGGASTEVDANTKNIILESATFNMYSIRRTSMVHGLFSEAVTRFNKGQSPYQNDRVLLAAAHLLCDGGAQFASDVFDEMINGLDTSAAFTGQVTVTTGFINDRLGLTLAAASIAELLANVGFTITSTAEELTINVPFWRTDIELEEDIVEEVGRLYGFDNVPLVLPVRRLTPASKDPLISLKQLIRTSLGRAGANEVLTYSFVHGDVLKKVGQDPQVAYKLTNALSPDLQYYRLSLTPSLLDKVNANVRSGYGNFALFELGKTHQAGNNAVLTDEAVPREANHLSLVLVADDKATKQLDGAAYYQVRNYVTVLLQQLSINQPVRFEQITTSDQDTVYYAAGRAAIVYVADRAIGYLGEYSSHVAKAFKLPAYTAGFELDTTALLELTQQSSVAYQVLPKYPKIEQDICLRVDSQVTYEQLVVVVNESLQTLDHSKFHVLISPIDIYQRPDDNEYKQITLRLSLANYERTMTEIEVTHILDAITTAAQASLQAERV